LTDLIGPSASTATAVDHAVRHHDAHRRSFLTFDCTITLALTSANSAARDHLLDRLRRRADRQQLDVVALRAPVPQRPGVSMG
jgi:hypothetical protein